MQWIKDIKNETEYNLNRTFYSSCMQENNDQELHQQISTEFQLTYHEITFWEGFAPVNWNNLALHGKSISITPWIGFEHELENYCIKY